MINNDFFQISTDTTSNARKDIYIARKKRPAKLDEYNNEIVEYEKPFFFGNMNYQPLTWKTLQSYMSVYGETQSNVVQLLVDISDADRISPFDLAYLYGTTPDGETVDGDNANYLVKACRPQNTKIMVILEEIIKNKE